VLAFADPRPFRSAIRSDRLAPIFGGSARADRAAIGFRIEPGTTS
jgi:hypothetical protein